MDDNPDMRDYVARLLGAHHAVEIVGDGASALALALTSPPDLVLSDVMLPGMDGYLPPWLRRPPARTAE